MRQIFSAQPTPPKEAFDVFRYDWVNLDARGKEVVVVSSFARLMRRQFDAGALEKLRPGFQPKRISFFEFPYCYGNTGPHSDSFETIAWALESLKAKAGPDTVFLFSCGSMGVIIGGALHEMGASVYYCGGAMQLFFGIMGERWRQNENDIALYKGDDLLSSFHTTPQYWVDPVPKEFVPKEAAIVERGCYW